LEARLMRAAIITISTSKAKGEGVDASGPALAAFARGLGAEVAGLELVSDDRDEIESCLRRWSDDQRCDLILTSGGTGFAPTDVTPEATEAVIDREAPGIAEAMRAASREQTPHWMLSRATAGIRGRTLIVNFPGNPKSIGETAAALGSALPHGLALLAGRPSAHEPRGQAASGGRGAVG
jgi:molybdenum cofactor synthesis domain-containing protein